MLGYFVLPGIVQTDTMSTFDANTAGNLQEVEMQFAVKTVEHLEVGRGDVSVPG